MPITWRSKMSVGNPMIDNDHKHLIDLINDYESAVGAKDIDLLRTTFDGLLRYTKSHFNREETLMQAIHFKHFQEHRSAHEKLVVDLHRFHEGLLDSDKPVSLKAVSQFLHDWLINHVLDEDMKMKPFLESDLFRQTGSNWS